MRVGVIINPISGRDGHRPDAAKIRAALVADVCRSHGVTAEIAITDGPGDAARLSRQFVAACCDRVLAWGGDGTLNDVFLPLVGTSVIAGVIRGGSGDGFARGLMIPPSPAAAMAVALGAHVRDLDVGCFGPHRFLNVAGVGFDAAVARAFNRRVRRGRSGYVRDTFRTLTSYQPGSCTVELDGGLRVTSPFLVTFANGPQYGNGVLVAPAADPADGLLDAVIVEAGSAWSQLWRARRLFWGRMRLAAGLVRVQVHSARVFGDDLVCQVDGEAHVASGPIDVGLDVHKLRVAVPSRTQRGRAIT